MKPHRASCSEAVLSGNGGRNLNSMQHPRTRQHKALLRHRILRISAGTLILKQTFVAANLLCILDRDATHWLAHARHVGGVGVALAVMHLWPPYAAVGLPMQQDVLELWTPITCLSERHWHRAANVFCGLPHLCICQTIKQSTDVKLLICPGSL